MSLETPEQPDIDRLDLKHRDLLQREVMRQMLGEKPDYQIQLDWVLKYGEKISELIDCQANNDIRELALAGNYEEAAIKLIELLD
ncbi:MAG TPA: hypothetical protein PKL09_02115 [bacterium]|nr:hypothetical protein [bacterium]HNS34035.1 hypothetical protein [bacterium]HNZ73119.1 hypothetical protein [bacterium]HOH67006.1 hypothetical protein [bacterium]HQA63673.1 hypothetical protein [bacterium]